MMKASRPRATSIQPNMSVFFAPNSLCRPNNERRSTVLSPEEAAFGFLVLTDGRSHEDQLRVEVGLHVCVDLVERFEVADVHDFPADDVIEEDTRNADDGGDLFDLLGKQLPVLDVPEVHEGDVGLWVENGAESLRFVDVDVLVQRVMREEPSTASRS